MKPKKTIERKAIRCAIYTRKSTEEGLDQDFNSLDAQRESAEAYIKSQASEGWITLPHSYDDGGFSGGNIDRPALKRLLADVEDGKVDCIVVYKVDRLSRSLLDFARLMEVLDRNGCSFVSVTQQFNTTNSMGRLILNILLSFAQFEREIIAERTRDKMSAARKKGKHVGGVPVLGYDLEGLVESYADLARLGGVSFARMSQILNLLNLAPDIQEKILFLKKTSGGHDPISEWHLRDLVANIEWKAQRRDWKRLVTY